MKSQSTIRRSMIATLLVFATAAIGLQSLAFTSGSACSCSATETVEAVPSVTESSCCSRPVQDSEPSCCSTKQAAPTSGCCCNPDAMTCKCVDCNCNAEEDQPVPLSPAVPPSESNETVSPVLICAAPVVGYPREVGKRLVAHPRSAPEFAALSSHCLLYTSPSPRDLSTSRMPSSA